MIANESSNLVSNGIITKGIRGYSSIVERRLDSGPEELNVEIAQEEQLDPLFITGFVDAEGCFSVSLCASERIHLILRVIRYIYLFQLV
jgi:hypothetical protein